MPLRVRELAEWLGAPFEGSGEVEIGGVAALDNAGAGDIAFAAGAKASENAASSRAGCLLVDPAFPAAGGRALIRVADPRTAFAAVVERFHPEERPLPGVHPSAIVHPAVLLGAGVSIGPLASVGEGSVIGNGVAVGAGCAIGRRVTIGDGSRLHAKVVVYDDVEVGQRVVLHSGCVLGADGFGFVMTGGRYRKFPQIGRVRIEDDVEIGANSCVDRAALGVTVVGEGTKLDNMVHVAHNCRIGKHVVIAAQTGFSGGVEIGDYAVIGGQVGVGDKVKIEPKAVIGSGAGILTSKIVRAGSVMWGTPARPLKEYLEQLASLARLPRLRKEIAELKQEVARLRGRPGAE